jgi:heme-degrading monooxygenase HmoA
MSNEHKTYTLGIWLVKPGKETEFVSEWASFAKWTAENVAGSGKGHLLQDEKNSSRFISFGSWENEKQIQQWRESTAFKDFVAKAKTLCDDFQPNTLKEVSTS